MKKIDAIQIFGSTQIELARALGKSKQAISHWGDDLELWQIYLVLGAAVWHGKAKNVQYWLGAGLEGRSAGE